MGEADLATVTQKLNKYFESREWRHRLKPLLEENDESIRLEGFRPAGGICIALSASGFLQWDYVGTGELPAKTSPLSAYAFARWWLASATDPDPYAELQRHIEQWYERKITRLGNPMTSRQMAWTLAVLAIVAAALAIAAERYPALTTYFGHLS